MTWARGGSRSTFVDDAGVELDRHRSPNDVAEKAAGVSGVAGRLGRGAFAVGGHDGGDDFVVVDQSSSTPAQPPWGTTLRLYLLLIFEIVLVSDLSNVRIGSCGFGFSCLWIGN